MTDTGKSPGGSTNPQDPQQTATAQFTPEGYPILVADGACLTQAWRQEGITWDGFVAKLDDVADHKECGGYVLGDFGGDGRRLNARCRSRWAVALDYDGAADDLIDRLRATGWRAAWYSSYSHRQPGKGLRYRVIVPLSRPVETVDDHRDAVAGVAEQIGAQGLDPASYSIGHLMFWPSAADAALHESGAQDGPVADTGDLMLMGELSEHRPPVRDTRAVALPSTPATRGQRAYALREIARMAADLETVTENRNIGLRDRARSAGGYAASAGLDPAEVAATMADAGVRAGLSRDEADRAARNGVRYGLAAPLPLPEELPELPAHLDDAHLAEWMMRKGLDGDWIWSRGLGWLHWDGRRWCLRGDEAAKEAVRRAAIAVNVLAAETGNPQQVAAMGRLLAAAKIRTLADLGRGVLAVDGSLFDQRPDLLNVGNGTVDLRTGQLLPHDRHHYLTKLTEVEYRPGATHQDWDQTLTALDPEVADYMQVRFGQGATGHPTSDDVLPILQGAGSNGKTTLYAAVTGALGDHAVQVPAKLLMASPNDHPTELMTLRGARVALLDETPEEGRLDVPRLKATLGQPTMTARAIRQDNVTWKATHSLFVATNYVPRVTETDHGTWRRLQLVRFTRTFPRDDKFRARMTAGRGGRREAVLAWVVEGAVRWYRNGMVMPKEPPRVAADGLAWREESDLVLGYLRDRIEFDPAACVLASELLEDFNDCLAARNLYQWSDRTLAGRFGQHEAVAGRGVEKVQRRDARGLSRLGGRSGGAPKRPWVWLGVRFRD